MAEFQLGAGEVGAAINCLSTEMRRWLSKGVFDSLSLRIIGGGVDALKAMLEMASAQTGVEEKYIAQQIAVKMYAPLATSFLLWYESWRRVPDEARAAGVPYMIYDDGVSNLALSIFLDSVVGGKPGLAMARKLHSALQNMHFADVRIVKVKKQLGRLGAGKAGTPRDAPFVKVVQNHMRDYGASAVLIDCMDYLKALNGFQAAYIAVSEIADIVADGKGLLLVNVRPAPFEDAELSLMESTMTALGERRRDPPGLPRDRARPWSVSPS
ncbi:MAG: DUF835 domain-containing protein [Euryarchaeota archaeon]|nr:DUF835 domain-containing protein [Euryarchaeota archaeon]